MTEYFEVIERDGPARLAELRLTQPITTPTIVDDVISDAGSLWLEDRDLPEGDESQITILPHRGFPRGTDPEVQTAFAPDYPAVDYPNGVVISEATAEDYGADVYVLSGVPALIGHASAFVDTVISVRQTIPDDAGLLFSGVATPQNLALLVYAGVDLVDTDQAVVAGTQGRYLLPDGSYQLTDLDVLPCPCPVCEKQVENFDREDCVDHNVNTLQSEIRRIQHRIRVGQIREYVEGVVRHEPWLTAALQEFDQQWGYLETRTPVFRNAEIKSTTTDTLRRVEIQRFADRVTSRYINRFDDVPLVLVPCSAKKPYSESQSHGQFHDAIQYRGHIVSMSSPIGVVPRELELTYPAQHYDSAVTGDWSQTEIEFVASVLERYLDRNQYPRVIAHVPPNGYDDICEKVANRINVSFDYTVTDHPTTDESLATLAETLEDERQISLQERNRKTLKAIADYQFGDQAGDAMFDSLTLQGRYPKLQGLNASGEQLISLVPQYGLLALTLKGAQRWDDSSVTTKRVTIEDFVPHGSVLAPGIISASDAIRVGEEVVIEGPSAFGVGRATMPGPAMESASRGVAVDVRHVREQ